MERKDKNNYYLEIAESVATRGTCLKTKYGAVIVSNDEIIATGYNGAPRGRQNCCDLHNCIKTSIHLPRKEAEKMCRGLHAAQNAIISAKRSDMLGSTLYLVGKNEPNGDYPSNPEPCYMCQRMIINAGIEQVIVRLDKLKYRVLNVNEFIEDEALTK